MVNSSGVASTARVEGHQIIQVSSVSARKGFVSKRR